jgi:hypothetical protein
MRSAKGAVALYEPLNCRYSMIIKNVATSWIEIGLGGVKGPR